MSHQVSDPPSDPGVFRTISQDLHRDDFKKNLRRDFVDLKDYFLNDDLREKLSRMSWIKRWFFTLLWLFKALFLKLTPTRRILFVISLFLILTSGTIALEAANFHYENDTNVIGIIILLFVFMLELKDKLIARSELEAGRTVQQALLPAREPDMPGWQGWMVTQAANEVGGDFVDLIQLKSNQFALVLGDVSGKGLGAALLMSKVQAILKALAPDYTTISDLAEKINRILYRDYPPNDFVTLIYMVVNRENGNIELINAGHLPPIIVRKEKILELSKGSPAFGLSAESEYTITRLNLAKEEMIFIYSDGLTEARNNTGEFFGEKRLFSLVSRFSHLSCRESGEIILSEVENFSAEAGSNDDLSLILFKRL